MLKNKLILLLVLVITFCINVGEVYSAKKPLTPQQKELREKLKAERMKKSEAADKLIRHVSPDEFKSTVLTDTENLWVIFYGSKKCPHTQKFNPKWLQFQQNLDDGIYNLENVKIAKVECNGKYFKFCVSQDNQYWPELMLYYNGVKKAAYDGEDEIEDILKYIRSKKDKFMGVKSGLPSKKPTKQIPKENTKRPTKQMPSSKQPPTVNKSTKQPPPPPSKELPPKVPNFNISGDDDVDNVNENEIEETVDDNYDNGGTGDYINDNTLIDEAPGSHFIVYSVGGCAACIAGLLIARKKFRGGHRYTRVGGNERRTSQMKYKYDKHIV